MTIYLISLILLLPLNFFHLNEQSVLGVTLTIPKVVSLVIGSLYYTSFFSLPIVSHRISSKINILLLYSLYIIVVSTFAYFVFPSSPVVFFFELFGILVGPLFLYIPLTQLFNGRLKRFSSLISYFLSFNYLLLILGLFEYILNLLGLWYLPKHIVATSSGYVANRFHSFYGEPREAGIFLLYLLSFHLFYCYKSNNKPKVVFISLIFLSIFLTQSVSVLIAISFSLLVFLTIHILRSLVILRSKIKLIIIPVIASVFVFLIYIATPFVSNQRLVMYLEGFQALSSSPISLLAASDTRGLSSELPNILPFYVLADRIGSFDFTSLTGRGILDSSRSNTAFILKYLGDTGLIHSRINPMASLPRILLEGGLISLFLFSFFYFSAFPDYFSYPLFIQYCILLPLILYFVYRSDLFYLFSFFFHFASSINIKDIYYSKPISTSEGILMP